MDPGAELRGTEAEHQEMIQDVHHVVMQAQEGPQLQLLLAYLQAYGVARVVFPAREYRSARVGRRRDIRKSLNETALLWPRGDDGGFAEAFLRDRVGP